MVLLRCGFDSNFVPGGKITNHGRSITGLYSFMQIMPLSDAQKVEYLKSPTSGDGEEVHYACNELFVLLAGGDV